MILQFIAEMDDETFDQTIDTNHPNFQISGGIVSIKPREVVHLHTVTIIPEDNTPYRLIIVESDQTFFRDEYHVGRVHYAPDIECYCVTIEPDPDLKKPSFQSLTEAQKKKILRDMKKGKYLR